MDDDERGENFSNGGGGGFNLLGPLLGFIIGRFGIGGVVILVLICVIFKINPLGFISNTPSVSPSASSQQHSVRSAQQACQLNAASLFSCRVLASTEDTWSKIFADEGKKYTPTTLVFYSQRGRSGCGVAESAMGPFYCPADQRVYLDTDFYNELVNRFHAGGDFAQAYVIAHEVGHHVQDLNGLSDQIREQQARSSKAQANALQVRMELQADCYAGVWAAHNRDRIESGDIEEGMKAAHAIGDDTLEKAAGMRPVPESFTHGTSEERMRWLRRGIESGNPAQCDTFNHDIDS
ncbi:MAG: neutral zinc metallopeptidase [Zymomonas mobilis subsp. pomaceae]